MRVRWILSSGKDRVAAMTAWMGELDQKMMDIGQLLFIRYRPAMIKVIHPSRSSMKTFLMTGGKKDLPDTIVTDPVPCSRVLPRAVYAPSSPALAVGLPDPLDES